MNAVNDEPGAWCLVQWGGIFCWYALLGALNGGLS